jgi:hypothetical protein
MTNDNMSPIKKVTVTKLLQVVGMGLIVEGLICGQSLNSKLLQKASFVPKSKFALDQLIEVAQHYQIPMGIEWIGRPVPTVSASPKYRPTTVRSLVATILRPYPDYRLKVVDGLVHITNQAFVDSPRNFLNIRISEFKVDKASMVGADASLRLGIKMALHPDRYANGYNGGYGGSFPADVLNIPNITFSGRNLTVRQILNKSVAANGNALWVVRLNPSRMMNAEPAFFAQEYETEDFHWQFVPLQEKTSDK